MTWEDGSQYSGDWKKGKMHGNGTYTYADGEIYQGGWKNGLRDGQGNSTHANGEKYQGGWKSDFMDGQGTYTYADGAQYQGDWKEGVKDGQGTHTWTNGDKYQGQYKKNKRDGQGTFTSANGQKYQGEFKNGLPDGQGTVTLANGNMYKVWHKEGNLTKKVKEKWQWWRLVLELGSNTACDGLVVVHEEKWRKMLRKLNFEVEARWQSDPRKRWKRLNLAYAAEHLRHGWKKVAAFLLADVAAMLAATLRCHAARSLRSTVAFVGRSHGGRQGVT